MIQHNETKENPNYELNVSFIAAIKELDISGILSRCSPQRLRCILISWPTAAALRHWFLTIRSLNATASISEHSFYGIFELAGKNVPEELMDKMQVITDILKPNDKRKSDFVSNKKFCNASSFVISDFSICPHFHI